MDKDREQHELQPCCALCGGDLPLSQAPFWHDCKTGETGPLDSEQSPIPARS